MPRYIDADELIRFFNGYPIYVEFNVGDIKSIINEQDTADVRENVRGHWELKTSDLYGLADKVTAWANYCSVCGYHYGTPYNFCPNCGAEMENSLAMNKKTKAKWVCLGHKMGFCKHPYSVDYKCSNCGYEEYTLLSSPPDKCPNCGAEMGGES